MIQHLRIEVLADGQVSARELQNELSNWCRSNAFWQRVSDRLDELVPPGAVLQISRLELEIGAADRAIFLDNLLEKLALAVENGVRERAMIPEAEYLHGHAIYFLIHGYLPVGSSAMDGSRVRDFLRGFGNSFHPDFGKMFRREMPDNPQMIGRLMHYAEAEPARRFLLAALLEDQYIDAHYEWIISFFAKNKNAPENGNADFGQWENAVWKRLFELPVKDVFESKLKLDAVLDDIVRKSGSSENQITKEESQPSQVDSTLFYIPNAGIVLLAPFFPQLFNALGWIGNRVWKSDAEISLAVRLIGYVCTGIVDNDEYDWVLPKILCGVPPETVINLETPMPEEAVGLSVKMMEAAIDQWKVLKSTTPEGLRELFIRRDGKLSRDDEGTGWRLQVDKKSQDALLERLPWGIAVIRLPWMDEMLLVEW
ncbi:contractile injection system tape measure protein [Dyadobacter sp. CY261]|uniref:contractile injection system tape measure protein n=1 Tax=Dyadobacter sp. CY261 TaxID=2907203 RepID=UPI001EEEE111|nr:contractile injection system tape measure protein [Dyadobacter sp. CY261]